jgi:uncharacterized protein (DUF934 family)
MCNSADSFNSAKLAAAINAAASIIAKDKSVDEIELIAIIFDMFSDTLFSIARIQKHQERLRRDDAKDCL